jgi:hypothetical protein
MNLRNVFYGMVLATGMFLATPTWAQSVSLNCVNGDTHGRVVFDEAAATAWFSDSEREQPASPATFTEREITWDVDADGFSHPYFTLSRTTGELRITHRRTKGPDQIHVWQCSAAKKQF